jgi:hypothetical protein
MEGVLKRLVSGFKFAMHGNTTTGLMAGTCEHTDCLSHLTQQSFESILYLNWCKIRVGYETLYAIRKSLLKIDIVIYKV